MSIAPDMLYHMGGVPVMSGVYSNPWGTHYFVDGTNGNDNNSGKTPGTAKATIQSAVTASTADTASRGDVIYINPGIWNTGTGFYRYDEAVAITSGVTGTDMTNSNMSIIGITGPGATGDFLGVRWKETSTVALTNDAPALHVENIGFFSEGANQAVLLQHDGATDTKQGTQGTSFYNCGFKGKGIYGDDGGDGLTVVNCRFQSSWDGNVAAIDWTCSANPGRRLTIRNCEWLDGNGTPPDAPCIVVAPPCTEILITDCYFPQESAANSVFISMAGANEGLIANCYFAVADLDTDAQILPGGCLVTAIYDVSGLATTA